MGSVVLCREDSCLFVLLKMKSAGDTNGDGEKRLRSSSTYLDCGVVDGEGDGG